MSLDYVQLAVIINSFNRLKLLKQALPSIIQALEVVPIQSAIIVFDAGSTDGSAEFIQSVAAQTQNLSIVCLCPPADSDRSFSAGCNAAVEFASQTFKNLKYCFFFETDNLIRNNAALPLAIQLLNQETDLAAVGFTVEKCDGTKAGFGSRFPSPFSFLVGQQLSYRLGLEKIHISKWRSLTEGRWGISEVVFTSPLLVRFTAWKATSGMDSTHFPYSDSDNDWCWTIYKQGWKTAVLDVPGVIHDNQLQTSSWSANRVLDFHRARLYLLKKHWHTGIDWLKPLLLVRHSFEFLLLWIRALRSEQAQNSLTQRWILIKTVFNNYGHL
jgi:GT2 family glycosyltransferase